MLLVNVLSFMRLLNNEITSENCGYFCAGITNTDTFNIFKLRVTGKLEPIPAITEWQKWGGGGR